jgi:hypothetical protein
MIYYNILLKAILPGEAIANERYNHLTLYQVAI